jgi:hypothetical protein
VNLAITFTPAATPDGWKHFHPDEAINSLPADESGGHIDRIYVADALEYYDPELLPVIAQSWHAHPRVTVRTLLAVTGRRDGSVAAYRALRPAGWGIAIPYDTRRLVLAGWPVTPADKQYGALARAIK